MATQTTNAITPIDMQALANDTGYDQRRLELIKARYFVEGADDQEFELFMVQASRRGLDPTRKHIYAVERYNSQKKRKEIAYQVSIDGLRLIAERSGVYEGQTAPQWCGPDGQWRDVWLEDDPPAAARVGVYRTGFRDPIYAVARYQSYVQTKPVYKNGQRTDESEPNTFWASMPDLMLSKCAESLALRKAFPEEAGGVYTSEEMGQADNDPRHIEVQGRSVDRDTGVIEATVDEPDPDEELNQAKKALWVVVHNGYGWSEQDLELVVADTYGDDGITSAAELDVKQLDKLRDEVQKLTADERTTLIAELRKAREAA